MRISTPRPARSSGCGRVSPKYRQAARKGISSRRRHGEFRDRRDILATAGWTNAMSDADNTDGLDDNFRDKLVALGKAAAGLVPIAGGPLPEIVGAVVPGQRADRIATYLRQLATQIGRAHVSTPVTNAPLVCRL